MVVLGGGAVSYDRGTPVAVVSDNAFKPAKKVDIKLPKKGGLNSHGARPVH